MSKILISPLGAGYINPQNKANREYRPAKYKIKEQFYTSSFIAAVLYEHLQLDSVIFIGTVKSMWEEVYRFFCEEKRIECNEKYYCDLLEKIEQLNHHSSLESIDLFPLEKVLGSRSKCILIKYGLNETELQENFENIIKIVDSLQDGDELYIDITHSFRSLSMFLFLVMIFVNDLAAERNIKIKGVYYGMLDVIRELEYAPVVDLQSLFDLTQWLKGAYSLKEFGNGYLISELLEEQGEEKLSQQIHRLSEAININYLPTIQQRASDLKTTLQHKNNSSPFKYIKNILEAFVQQFASKSDRESDFQLKLAKWYFDNKRYATGYITLTEAIITYTCEINNKSISNQSDREEMKKLLHTSEKDKELAQLYFKVNLIRKAIAHASLETRVTDYQTAIADVQKYHNQGKKIFKSGGLGNLVR